MNPSDLYALKPRIKADMEAQEAREAEALRKSLEEVKTAYEFFLSHDYDSEVAIALTDIALDNIVEE
ncbi:hypothetical protein CDES_07695 [Corynebacterium deserti GIMN1.010]|uniref:Uncharacterized protein n=1 Tax=Corynebacterium deserti GIMN1.010 TaxID=931089 RepID=A0A0M5IJ13_9CORY|nr:hypothetical protein [Corynebacterium deserti]ALC05948.1 hypothetical protein CDES_07695 [Corynebacterium deserti GIMN1.010]